MHAGLGKWRIRGEHTRPGVRRHRQWHGGIWWRYRHAIGRIHHHRRTKVETTIFWHGRRVLWRSKCAYFHPWGVWELAVRRMSLSFHGGIVHRNIAVLCGGVGLGRQRRDKRNGGTMRQSSETIRADACSTVDLYQITGAIVAE